MLDIGLLVIRVVIGGLLAAHGAQKLFGAFGGYGMKGTAGWLASLGLRPGVFWALLAGLGEFGGGLLFALGLLTPLGSVAVAAAMTMAILLAHRQALWVSEGGMEYNLVLIAVAAAVALMGPGAFSLDALLGVSVPAVLTAAAAVLAALTVVVGFSSREQLEPQAQVAGD